MSSSQDGLRLRVGTEATLSSDREIEGHRGKERE